MNSLAHGANLGTVWSWKGLCHKAWCNDKHKKLHLLGSSSFAVEYSRKTDNTRTNAPLLIHFFLSLFQEMRAKMKTLVHDTWVWERWVISLCQSPGLGLIYLKLITKLYLLKQRAFVVIGQLHHFKQVFYQDKSVYFCFFDNLKTCWQLYFIFFCHFRKKMIST